MDTVFISCHPIKLQLSGVQQQKNWKEWPENEARRLPGVLYTTHISLDLFCSDNKVPASALSHTKLIRPAATCSCTRNGPTHPETQQFEPPPSSCSKFASKAKVYAATTHIPSPGGTRWKVFSFCSPANRMCSPPRQSQHHMKRCPQNQSLHNKKVMITLIINTF